MSNEFFNCEVSEFFLGSSLLEIQSGRLNFTAFFSLSGNDRLEVLLSIKHFGIGIVSSNVELSKFLLEN